MVKRFGGVGGGVGCFFAAGLLFGCSSDDPEPTYSEDVAPLLQANCTTCHQAGGIAPFVLTDYASARARAADIADATGKREMPPMPVNNDGSCNTYSNARWLTSAEIATLQAWSKAGAPEGPAAGAAKVPPPPPSLSDPDAVVDIGTDYTPNASLGGDDYRCFIVRAPADERQFVTEYEVIPGDPRVVHHVIVYQPSSADAVTQAHALDDGDAGDGYTCFGSSGIDASPLALWAPGAGSVALPAGTGVELVSGRELVVQIHYNLENGVFPDRTQVALRFAKEPVISGYYWAAADTEMVLPPGQAHVESSASNAFDQPASFKVHGAIPHMHTLGRTLKVNAAMQGGEQCLVDVDRWDFHWQNAWWYDEPLTLSDVKSLDIRCGFDTRSRSDTVRWGDSTHDEMCISYFYVTTSDAPTPVISCDDTENPLFGSCFDDLLTGCYEPDQSGTCSVSGTTLTWPDGSRVEAAGDSAGLYGPGDDEPCVTFAGDQKGVQVTRGKDTLTYVPAGGGNVAVTCPDGSAIGATGFQFGEFASCRGLTCGN
jgi:hypothetical protein